MISTGRDFARWLSVQLTVTGISRRQLAAQSGVDHSSISRILRGDRTPSLETATKLARVLPDSDGELARIPGFRGIAVREPSPTARVEYALRADQTLSGDDIRAVMHVYITVRSRRERGAAGSVAGAKPSSSLTRVSGSN
jgi:transcriptional regulator with XRE-family HTH domain